ncbi:MAG TPA: hypothetical protein VEX36_03975 [Thermoleophilaceae bacterium]|nr:hypothetical protein [Thermoleophilaceae bacterium]
MIKVGAAVAATVAVMTATGHASEAQAAWSRPFQPLPTGQVGLGVQLAASPWAPGSVIAWESGNQVLRVRRIGPGGSRGPVRTIGRSDEPSLVAVDRRGVATVVWFDAADHSLNARRLSVSSRLGPVLRVAGPALTGDYPYRSARLAVDADGDATVVWAQIEAIGEERLIGIGAGAVHARRVTADHRLGPVLDPSHAGDLDVAPRVAVTPSGRATMAWVRTTAGVSTVVASRIGPGRAGAVHTVSDPTHPPHLEYSSDGIEVTSDPAGRSTVVWRTGGGPGGPTAVAARRLRAGGELGPTRAVAPLGAAVGPIHALADRAGRVAVLWYRQGDAYTIEARRLAPRGGMGSLQTIAGPSEYLSHPDATVDSTGRVTVVWASGINGKRHVRVRHAAPGGPWGPARRISRRRAADILSPHVVASGPDDLLATWSRIRRPNSVVEAVRR